MAHGYQLLLELLSSAQWLLSNHQEVSLTSMYFVVVGIEVILPFQLSAYVADNSKFRFSKLKIIN